MALADDIVYNNHDLDDGLRAGLFTIGELTVGPLVREVFASVQDRYPDLEWSRLVHESVRRLIRAMVMDLLEETCYRLAGSPSLPDAVRHAGRSLAALSNVMRYHNTAYKSFLFSNTYRHDRINPMIGKTKCVVTELFDTLVSRLHLLPEDWQYQSDGSQTPCTAQLVADYISLV